MSGNQLRIAIRNLWRSKTLSFIHIVGLAFGMSACLLIYLYVSYELSYDGYHTNADRIYRLVNYVKSPDGEGFGPTAPAVGPALRKEFPEIEAVARINFKSYLVGNGDRAFQDDNVMVADSSLFSIFSFPLSEGNSRSALVEPFSVVISETARRKYFGKEDPIGKTLILDRMYPVKVTGVMQDIPANSHFTTDIILSMTTMSQKLDLRLDSVWGGFAGHTYVLLPKGYQSTKLEAKLAGFAQKYTLMEMKKYNMSFTLSLEPLKSIYLHGKYASPESGNVYHIYIFSLIALFILLIACFNFVNLSTAGSSERAKEIGVRKVIGSSRRQLIWLFLQESLMICFIAFILSCLLSVLLIPVLNELCGETITAGIIGRWRAMVFLPVIALSIGLAAGAYPAFILSGFKASLVLKGRFSSGQKGIALRRGLVVTQFAISTVLIIGTLVVYRQLVYMRSQPLGFKKDQMLVIDFHGDPLVKGKMETIKQEMMHIPGILSASASSGIPNSGYQSVDYEILDKTGTMQPIALSMYEVDEDFYKQYQLTLVAGRVVSRDRPTDIKDGMILNESAVKKLGYSDPQAIIGSRFSGEGSTGTVIGVVKDFHFRSLQEEIAPLAFRTFALAYNDITLNIASQNMPQTIDMVESKWKHLVPERPFSYFFLDNAIDREYKSEANFGRLFLYFAIFAIFISSLGLFGLTLFSTVQRAKEIGIRKILGASVTQIIGLLSGDLLRWVAIAFVIAIPVGWFAMNKWLQEFAYRSTISWWMFFLAGGIALLIALLTVSFQAIKSATANPVDSLRVE